MALLGGMRCFRELLSLPNDKIRFQLGIKSRGVRF